MRVVRHASSFFAGDTSKAERNENMQSKGTDAKTKKSSIFAGNLNLPEDQITKKKREARKRAAKIISSAFSKEREIDDTVAECRKKISDAKKNMQTANNGLKDIAASQDELKKTYGITADSQEQKDLELLRKRRDMKDPVKSQGLLTADEGKRLREINETGLTEYQSRALELDKIGETYQKEIDAAKKVVAEQSDTIASIRQSRLKSAPMLDVTQAADGVMEAASDEVKGMILQESKDTLDKKYEEEKEKAEKTKEEKEKFEEQLEETRKKKEEMEPEKPVESTIQAPKTDSHSSVDDTTELLTELSTTKDAVQKELEKLMEEMQLTEEDLKGLEVDTLL